MPQDEPRLVPMCPECRADKHDNCNGDAWEVEADEPVVCICWAEGHPL